MLMTKWMWMLMRVWKAVFAVAVVGLSMSAVSYPSHAAGFVPGACGTSCMAMGGAMNPFLGLPFVPAPMNYNPYQTGQMSWYGANSAYPLLGVNARYVNTSPVGGGAAGWFGGGPAPGAMPMAPGTLPVSSVGSASRTF